jgi:hypothetical protein
MLLICLGQFPNLLQPGELNMGQTKFYLSENQYIVGAQHYHLEETFFFPSGKGIRYFEMFPNV